MNEYDTDRLMWSARAVASKLVQALAYDLNVTGLDDALRAYVGIRSAMKLPANRPATRPATPSGTRKADSK